MTFWLYAHFILVVHYHLTHLIASQKAQLGDCLSKTQNALGCALKSLSDYLSIAQKPQLNMNIIHMHINK